MSGNIGYDPGFLFDHQIARRLQQPLQHPLDAHSPFALEIPYEVGCRTDGGFDDLRNIILSLPPNHNSLPSMRQNPLVAQNIPPAGSVVNISLRDSTGCPIISLVHHPVPTAASDRDNGRRHRHRKPC